MTGSSTLPKIVNTESAEPAVPPVIHPSDAEPLLTDSQPTRNALLTRWCREQWCYINRKKKKFTWNLHKLNFSTHFGVPISFTHKSVAIKRYFNFYFSKKICKEGQHFQKFNYFYIKKSKWYHKRKVMLLNKGDEWVLVFNLNFYRCINNECDRHCVRNTEVKNNFCLWGVHKFEEDVEK